MSGADLRERILATALANPAVRDVHDVSIYVDSADHHVVALHLKLDGNTSLQEAHDAAERVEKEITELDDRVTAVQSHLEPLETPVTHTTQSTDDGLARTVTRLLGRAPLDLQVRDTESGPVAFLTIAADAGTDLAAAHDLASRLEHDLRLERPEKNARGYEARGLNLPVDEKTVMPLAFKAMEDFRPIRSYSRSKPFKAMPQTSHPTAGSQKIQGSCRRRPQAHGFEAAQES